MITRSLLALLVVLACWGCRDAPKEQAQVRTQRFLEVNYYGQQTSGYVSLLKDTKTGACWIILDSIHIASAPKEVCEVYF